MTMKKIIILITSLLLICSCSSRKVGKTKEINKQEQKVDSTKVKDSFNISKSIERSFNISDFSNLNLSVKPLFKIDSSKCKEPRIIRVVDKTGNKVEIPVYSNSEISFGSTKKKDSIYTDKNNISETILKEKTSLIKENKSLKEQLSKTTKKSGITFGSLLIIILVTMVISILLWELIKKQFKL